MRVRQCGPLTGWLIESKRSAPVEEVRALTADELAALKRYIHQRRGNAVVLGLPQSVVDWAAP